MTTNKTHTLKALRDYLKGLIKGSKEDKELFKKIYEFRKAILNQKNFQKEMLKKLSELGPRQDRNLRKYFIYPNMIKTWKIFLIYVRKVHYGKSERNLEKEKKICEYVSIKN